MGAINRKISLRIRHCITSVEFEEINSKLFVLYIGFLVSGYPYVRASLCVIVHVFVRVHRVKMNVHKTSMCMRQNEESKYVRYAMEVDEWKCVNKKVRLVLSIAP